jgi:hypothetical protein
LTQAFQTLATKLTDAQALDLAPRAKAYVASTGDEAAAEAMAGIFTSLVIHEKDNAKFLSDILEAIKYPATAGKPTVTLMNALRRRFPDVAQLEGSLEDAVPWFQEKKCDDIALASALAKTRRHFSAGFAWNASA